MSILGGIWNPPFSHLWSKSILKYVLSIFQTFTQRSVIRMQIDASFKRLIKLRYGFMRSERCLQSSNAYNRYINRSLISLSITPSKDANTSSRNKFLREIGCQSVLILIPNLTLESSRHPHINCDHEVDAICDLQTHDYNDSDFF